LLNVGDVLPVRENQTMGGEEGSFVFATDRYTEALVYASTTPQLLFNFQIQHPANGKIIDASVVAVPDGQTDLNKIESGFSGGNVVQVLSESFKRVSYVEDGNLFYPGEWVSEHSVPVSKITNTFSTYSEIMKEGLLIFAIEYSKIKSKKTLNEIEDTIKDSDVQIVEENGLLFLSAQNKQKRTETMLIKCYNGFLELKNFMRSDYGRMAFALEDEGMIQLLNRQVDRGLDCICST